MSKASSSRRSDDFDDAVESAANAAGEALTNINHKLKAVGVDTDVMKDAAKEQVSDLQKLIADELKARPLRTLGIAAGVGLLVGLLATR